MIADDGHDDPCAHLLMEEGGHLLGQTVSAGVKIITRILPAGLRLARQVGPRESCVSGRMSDFAVKQIRAGWCCTD